MYTLCSNLARCKAARCVALLYVLVCRTAFLHTVIQVVGVGGLISRGRGATMLLWVGAQGVK